VTRRQVDAQKDLAKDERIQSRRAEAYLELFEHIARITAWVSWVLAVDQQGLSNAAPEPKLIDDERWYRMIALARGFGSREVLVLFTDLHNELKAIAASLERHGPPFDPYQAQEAAYHDAEESKERRELCWQVTKLIYTVQPHMANELQGETHAVPTPEQIRSAAAANRGVPTT
jgi:hypothetical protein